MKVTRSRSPKVWSIGSAWASVLLAGALALLAGCQPIVAPANQPEIAMPAISQEQTDAIDAIVEGMMIDLGVPGTALGIVQNGELVFAKGYGVTEIGMDNPVTPQTVFNLASVAKTLTATAVMQLVEQGKVDLNEPVTTYLPYFEMADERYQDLTVRHVMTHRTGLPEFEWTAPGFYDNPDNEDGALERFVRSLSDDALSSAPGEEFAYGTLNYAVLGEIIANASGESYNDYIRRHLLEPLAMDATHQLYDELDFTKLASLHIPGPDGGWIVNPIFPYARVEGPGGHFYTSLEDMAQYAIVHLRQGSGDNALLSPESYAQMWTKVSDSPFPPPDTGYGMGWMMGEHGGHRVVGHSGIDLGYNAFMSLLPDDDMALIILANQSDAVNLTSLPAFFMRDPILDILLGTTSAP